MYEQGRRHGVVYLLSDRERTDGGRRRHRSPWSRASAAAVTARGIRQPIWRLQPEKLAVRLFARPIERLDEPSGGVRTVS